MSIRASTSASVFTASPSRMSAKPSSPASRRCSLAFARFYGSSSLPTTTPPPLSFTADAR